MSKLVRGATGASLALLLVFSVFVEAAVLPLAANEALAEASSKGTLFPLVIAWGVLIALCGQIMIVITWRLTGFTADERIFTEKPLRLVTLLMLMPFIAALLLIAAFIGFSALGLTPPGIMFGLIGSTVLLLAMGFVLVTMRSLLIRAITLSTEMEQVV